MIRIFPDITAYLEIMLGGSKIESIFSIGKDFDRYKDEVNRHNGNMIEIMVYGGILMTILAILAQLFMGYLSAMLLAVRMLIYMLILVLLRRPVLSKIQNKTLLIYLLQAPILFTVLLMGTFMDPNHQAITIFVFVSVLPLLILDKPWRVAGWTAGWLLFFVICSYCLKESGHFRGDLLYSLEFGFSSTMVAIAIIVVRMRAIKNYIEAMPPVEDPLTGASNIYSFLSYSGDYLRRYRAGSKTPCIICIDVMNMKRYNSTFGYQKGSELLVRIADVLRDRFEGEPVARFSEDHFVILTTMEERDMKLMQIHAAERSLDEPIMNIHLATGTYQITGDEEIGIACDRAQLACDVVKREKERHPSRGFSDGIYDTALAEAQEKQEYVLSHIDEAIEKGWLTVYFQPIVRSVSGELCNEEALARWIDPKYGFLFPADFIPPLEERGLNYKVDLYIVKLVLDILKQRKVDGLPLLPISVNLSRTDFVKADMVNEISKLCDHAGIDHRLINIEITESSLAYQEEILKGEIKRFHENGFKVWMDDFGSGYSTLNVLKEYDFDLLKFDMRFVHEMTRGSKAEIILSDLVNMAKQLDIATLAEGVETEEQYDILRSIGCGRLQGYYFDSPHDYSYILERFHKGTEIPFENPELVNYLDIISLADLNRPAIIHAKIGSRTNYMATTIAEVSETEATVLRENQEFHDLMVEVGVSYEERLDHKKQIVVRPGTRSLEACKRAVASGRWELLSNVREGSIILSCFIKELAENPITHDHAFFISIEHVERA